MKNPANLTESDNLYIKNSSQVYRREQFTRIDSEFIVYRNTPQRNVPRVELGLHTAPATFIVRMRNCTKKALHFLRAHHVGVCVCVCVCVYIYIYIYSSSIPA